MKRTKKAQIIIEKECLIVVSRSRSIEHWCEFCGFTVRMIDAARAAAVFNIGQRKIFRAIENGLLHFVETDTGTLLICFASLTATFEQND